MGLFLASKLTRLALGAAQTALAAGEAYRTGKKIEKRVREALRPQKEDVITMKNRLLQPFWCSSPPLPAR